VVVLPKQYFKKSVGLLSSAPVVAGMLAAGKFAHVPTGESVPEPRDVYVPVMVVVEYQIVYGSVEVTVFATRSRASGPTTTPVKPVVDVCMMMPPQVDVVW
jgi:hypothetical protein